MTINIFKILILLTTFLMVAITSSLLQSEDPLSASNAKIGAGKQDAASLRPASSIDIEDETITQILVQTHLPELKPVLEQLQTDRPKDYQRAVRDLARSARKIDMAKKRDERLFDIEVELLKAETQASLLTARLTVRDHSDDRKRLQKAVTRLQIAKISKAVYSVETYRERLKRDQKQLNAAKQRLSRYQQDGNSLLEDAYLSLLRKAGREPEPAELRKKKRTEPAVSPEK